MQHKTCQSPVNHKQKKSRNDKNKAVNQTGPNVVYQSKQFKSICMRQKEFRGNENVFVDTDKANSNSKRKNNSEIILKK